MKFIEKNIGNGKHWNVYQIIYSEGMIPRSEVHKMPFPNSDMTNKHHKECYLMTSWISMWI